MRNVGKQGWRAAIMAGFAVAVSAAPALAHPHIWIEGQSAVVLDDAGRAEAIEVLWHFDEMYTIFATQGFDRDGDGAPDADKLDELAATMRTNLAEYGYFVTVSMGDDTVPVAPDGDFDVRVEDNRLIAGFTVALERPLPAAGLTYAVFDPTYYVEILHEDEGVAVKGPGAEACRPAVLPPRPPRQITLLAASADLDRQADDSVGIHFAERVSVQCDEAAR